MIERFVSRFIARVENVIQQRSVLVENVVPKLLDHKGCPTLGLACALRVCEVALF